LKSGQGSKVLEKTRFSNQLLDLVCQFQIVKHSTVINSIIISQIDSEEAIFSLLGTILLIAEDLIKGTLTIVLLIDPSRIEYEKYNDLLSTRIQFIFGSIAKDSTSKNRDEKEPFDRKVNIIERFASETSMLMPGYARKFAAEIWNLRFGHT
jgi:hypothetical protein